MSFGKSTSSKLIESVDDFIDLDLDLSKYLMNYRQNRKYKMENRK
jgi:hypothetical protein